MTQVAHSDTYNINILPDGEGYFGVLCHGHDCLFEVSGDTVQECYIQLHYYLTNTIAIYSDLKRQLNYLSGVDKNEN